MSQKGSPNGIKTGVGSIADDKTKEIWKRAWELLQQAPKTSAEDAYKYVAHRLKLSPKSAQRKIKCYRQWQMRLGNNLKLPRYPPKPAPSGADSPLPPPRRSANLRGVPDRSIRSAVADRASRGFPPSGQNGAAGAVASPPVRRAPPQPRQVKIVKRQKP